MLSELYIENVAIIRQASIGLREGFNVFTGETGAGKTILINAINTVLGARTSRDMIRSGERQALVSALFTGIPDDIAKEISALGYEAEDGQLLITRTIDSLSSGVCKIGGRPATASVLRGIAGLLIDVHGQHDSQDLLLAERHLHFLDAFGGLETLLAEYKAAYRQYTDLCEELERLQMDENDRLRRIDTLQYQIDEIEEARIVPGEGEALTAQRDLIRNAEKVTGALSGIYNLLNGGEDAPGVLEALDSLEAHMETAVRYVDSIGSFKDDALEAVYTLRDLSAAAHDALEACDFDPRQLDAIESRLDTLHRLRKKYGADEDEILAYLENAKQELDELTGSDQKTERLTAERDAAENEARTLALRLTEERTQAGERFTALVEQELEYLDMPRVSLSIRHTRKELGPTGADDVEFLISANVGEQPKPLSKIASGGELSRIMLAIKTVMAEKDRVGTLIFDEIDTGVSGRAAQKIGRKLAQVAQNRQVLCITHLAQVAAWADYHLRIYKTADGKHTFTHIEALDRTARIEELARITGGEEITETARRNADELLSQAGK